jgi:hypothetical protein
LNPTTTTLAREEQPTSTTETAATSAVRIFPNPVADGYFNITLPSSLQEQPVMVSVWDLDGRLVLKKIITTSTRIVHQFRSGVYIVQVISKKEQGRYKLVVQ